MTPSLEYSLIGLTLCVAACSSSSPANGGTGGGGGEAGNACVLLTQDQVSQDVGVSVGGGDSTGDPHLCLWSWDDPNDPLSIVNVIIMNNISLSTFDEGVNGSGGGLTFTPVSGVGDGAHYVDAGVLGTSLDFKKGNLVFSTSVSAMGSAQSQYSMTTIQADEKTLALDVLSSL